MTLRTPAGLRALLFWIACVGLLGGAGCTSSLPFERALVPASALFGGAVAKADISRHLDAAPRQCLSLGPESEICDWHIGEGHPRYEELSDHLGVSDLVAVFCVFPASAAPPDVDHCWLQQRRSNRGQYRVMRKAQPKMTMRAFRQVREAGTLLEMIRLLGQLPEWCRERSGVERVCEWRLSNKSYGHGTIARVAAADPRGKVRWICRFPLDGRSREAQSCEGEAL